MTANSLPRPACYNLQAYKTYNGTMICSSRSKDESTIARSLDADKTERPGRLPARPCLFLPVACQESFDTDSRTAGIFSLKISPICASLIISGGDRATVSPVMRSTMSWSWKPFSMAL